jgi:ABC-type transport system substrate-binding protein
LTLIRHQSAEIICSAGTIRSVPESRDVPCPRLVPPTLSRRHLVRGGLAGGLAVMTSLGGEVSPRSPRADRNASAAARHASPATFTLATNRTPSDLDPHSAYDAGSGVVLQGPFEGLIRLKPGTTDEILPVLAASWAPNADASVWTFQLRDGVTFHDGAPLDAEAARASFERLLSLGLAPSSVLGRFITDPAMISAPDSHTLVFALGQPQPLFDAALASAYGTAVVNVAALRKHDIGGDWGHTWAQTHSEGLGTGPYRVVDFDIEQGVVLERFGSYWGGWDGAHFDQIINRRDRNPPNPCETRLRESRPCPDVLRKFRERRRPSPRWMSP